MKGLADRIPADALVLLSDAEAGMQLQIPLQYSEGRPTLLVPLEAEPGSMQWVVLTRYLERQLGAGRKVFAVFQNPPVRPNVLAANFQLTHLFSTTISFLQRPQVAQSRFPRETARARVQYHAFNITRYSRPASTRETMIRDLSKGIDFAQLMLPHYVALAVRVGDDLQELDLPQARETIRLDFEPSTPSNSIEIRIPNPTSPGQQRRIGGRASPRYS